MTGTRARKLPIIPLSDAPPLSCGRARQRRRWAPNDQPVGPQENDLSDVLVSFYPAVADDPLLAPYFASLDMSTHMPRIVAFWSTILSYGPVLGERAPAALSMPGLTAEHFASWVATLEHTLDARCAGENVERMKGPGASGSRSSMQLRLGVMPSMLLRPGTSA